MAIESYVEDILKSPELTFRKIVSKIVQKSDKSAKTITVPVNSPKF